MKKQKEEWLSHIYHKRSRLTASQWFTEKEIVFISEELHKAYNQGMSKGYIKGRESLQNYIQELQKAERRVRKEISKIITEYEELNTDDMFGTFDYEEFGKRMVELKKLLNK